MCLDDGTVLARPRALDGFPILGSRDSARTRVLSPPLLFFFVAAHVMCVKRKHLLIMDHCYATGTRKDEEEVLEVLEEQTCTCAQAQIDYVITSTPTAFHSSFL